METFKDIERENKTKPHSKQGLSAEEKLDPREKEKADAIEWFKVCGVKFYLFPLHNRFSDEDSYDSRRNR